MRCRFWPLAPRPGDIRKSGVGVTGISRPKRESASGSSAAILTSMGHRVALTWALLLLLAPLPTALPVATDTQVPQTTPAVAWTIPEAAEEYLSIIGPFNRARASLNRMTVTRRNARRYCAGVVRMLDRSNLAFSRGLWPTTITGDVKRLLSASVLLRSNYRQCQAASSGASAVSVLQRTGGSNQRLWDTTATQAGLIRLSLGLPPP